MIKAAPGWAIIKRSIIDSDTGFWDHSNPSIAYSVWGEVASVTPRLKPKKNGTWLYKALLAAMEVEKPYTPCNIKHGDIVAFNYRFNMETSLFGGNVHGDMVFVPLDQIFLKKTVDGVKGVGNYVPVEYDLSDNNIGDVEIGRQRRQAWHKGISEGKTVFTLPYQGFAVNNPFDGDRTLFAVEKKDIIAWI